MASNSDNQNLDFSTLSSVSYTFHEREFISKLLSEKRTLIATLHHEKKDKIKWKELYERKVEQFDKLQSTFGSSAEKCTEQLGQLSLDGANCHQNETKLLYQKLREKDEKITNIECKNQTLRSQIAILKSEVMRLSGSLTKLDTESVDKDVLREQLQLYEQDFNKEKNEKVDAQQKLTILTQQIQENQEIIQSLTVEVDMYKKAFEREKHEKEKLVARNGSESSRHSVHHSSRARHQAIPRPQLQIVYPIASNDQEEHDEMRRRRELQQVGVLTRDIRRSPTRSYSDKDEDDSSWWTT